MTLVLFYQTENIANGGVKSLLNIIYGLDSSEIILVTNKEVANTHLVTFNVKWPFGSLVKRVLNFPIWSLTIIRILVRNNIEKIVINDFKTLIVFFPFLFLRNFKVIFNVRDTLLNYSAKWKILLLVDEIVCMSEEMKLHLAAKIDRRLLHKIVVCYSIINMVKSNNSTGSGRVFFLGSFCQKKNQMGMLRALDRHKPNFRTVFFGDVHGSYGNECLNLVRSSNYLNQHVEIRGYQELPFNYIGYGDIVTQPSEREGMARSMLESLSIGVPVVSFDVCSAREVLEQGRCGIVVNQGDYKELFNNICWLLNDASAYRIKSENALATISQRFDKVATLAVYRRIYL